jgi:hypothetical protein
MGGLFGNFAFAQAPQVSVTPAGATYSLSAPQVSCTVKWTEKPYNGQIWVIADYVKVEGASTVGTWSRALVTGATVTAGTGTASTATGNRGFWLHTGDSEKGSATVTATLQLRQGVLQFSWCAYAFDFPPHAVLQSGGSYQLHGTRPFRVNNVDLVPWDAGTYSGNPRITAFSDFTGCPGIWEDYVDPCFPGTIGAPAACSTGFTAGNIGMDAACASGFIAGSIGTSAACTSGFVAGNIGMNAACTTAFDAGKIGA